MSAGNGAVAGGDTAASTRIVLQAAFWLGGLFAPPRGRRCAVCNEHMLLLELRDRGATPDWAGPAVVGSCSKCAADRAIVTFVNPGEACWLCRTVADAPATGGTNGGDPGAAVRLCAHFNNVREGTRLILTTGGGPRAAG